MTKEMTKEIELVDVVIEEILEGKIIINGRELTKPNVSWHCNRLKRRLHDKKSYGYKKAIEKCNEIIRAFGKLTIKEAEWLQKKLDS